MKKFQIGFKMKASSLLLLLSTFLFVHSQDLDTWDINLTRLRRSSSPSASSLDIEGLDMLNSAPIIRNVSDEVTSENVTAQLGSSVFLACKTHHSMERQVSWVRRRDWHILTSGTLPYTQEERFLVHHPEGSTEWTLEIKYAELSDEGTYECQIATGGGIISHLVHVKIVEPKAVIPGNGEYHVETGSTITLDCIIEQSPVAPQFIFWYHNDRMINYDTERGTVNIVNGPPQVRSRLTVTDARPTDSGNYTCAAANTASASIMVYITEANKIAVIQTRAVDNTSSVEPSFFLILIITSLSINIAHFLTQGLVVRRTSKGEFTSFNAHHPHHT
ncbi:UNVERIFIED_CONTAM: hypothetical protein RMT77_010629 [Armadillidium vulgare]